MNKDIQRYKKAMKNEEILEGVVVLTQHDKELGTDIVAMNLNGFKGIIKREDLDNQVKWNSLVGFIGRKVSFLIKEIDEENKIIYCSRKEAQEKTMDATIKMLETGEPAKAIITGIVRYGAYAEVNGVYGLIENKNFSNDFIKIGDVMNVGDTIDITLLNKSENGNLTFVPVEKYVLKDVLQFDNFEKNQVVLGKISTIKPRHAFVNIALGLDALCPIPENQEIEEGLEVSFRITQVQHDKKRVRGKILRVIN